MSFSPHILLKEVSIPFEEDEFGRPIPGTGGVQWLHMCKCRCDDNTTKEFKSENGNVYRPKYHVVCSGIVELSEGDSVRCVCDGVVRGKGTIFSVRHSNYFHYTEVWI